MRRSKISLTDLRKKLSEDSKHNQVMMKAYKKSKEFDSESFTSGVYFGKMIVHIRVIELCVFGKNK